jgi:phosphoglycolate phosphatase
MDSRLSNIDCDALIFDLDGVLWDTSETCAAAWNRVCARHAIAFREITAADVRAVTGRPHVDAIRSVFTGLERDALQVLVEETQHEDNRAIANEGALLYPAVLELVPILSRVRPLMIVSNCQAGYIETFLEFSGLGPYFTDLECWGNTGQAKPCNLRAVIARNALRRPIFIGDTQGDGDAAAANECPFVHAAYGFGQVTHPDASIQEFAELAVFAERPEATP